MNNFNLQCFLDCANELVRADEVERAIHLLSNLPGYYRDHEPVPVTVLRNQILARIATPTKYAEHEGSLEAYPDGDKWHMGQTLRGMIIIKELERLNSLSVTPTLVDLAPENFWLRKITEHLDRSYRPISLGLVEVDKEPLNVPLIFCALELIEHLWREDDIKIESLRFGRLPDVVHISTPMYSFDEECTDWRKRDLLGHLRTYTPAEFNNVLKRLFPEYEIVRYEHKVMHARLVLRSSEFQEIKESAGKDLLSL